MTMTIMSKGLLFCTQHLLRLWIVLLFFLLLFVCNNNNNNIIIQGQIINTAGAEGTTTAEAASCSTNDENNGSCTVQEEEEEQQQQDSSSSLLSSACQDHHESCSYWASIGECNNNPTYMHSQCSHSCQLCSHDSTTTTSPHRMDANRLDDLSDIGAPQVLVVQEWNMDYTTNVQLQTIVQTIRHYMTTNTMAQDLKEICQNKHEMCTLWAYYGECEANPNYMKEQCAPACQSCEYTTIEGRCPVDPNAKHAWGPGDLDIMFRRLVAEPYKSQYNVTILSSPDDDDDNNDPWVIIMDNFLSKTEADHLIELGSIEGYERSTDVGDMKKNGDFNKKISTGRTSTNAWCMNDCYKNATARAVVDRISEMTGIDEVNSEYLQLLRYERGQLYHEHHDYIPFERNRQQGVRILTVYLYLNDVEAGGGTNFPRLKNNITVLPKRGRALFWPSVLNMAPNKVDGRMNHQALPVEAGVKYGANAWFHNRDFKTPNANHCQ